MSALTLTPRSKHRQDTCPECGYGKDARAALCRRMECRLRRRIAMNPESECWEWTGVLEPTGYGRMSVNGRNVMAHRICYELHVGPIPDGLFLDHLCHNRRCVNPEHLEPVTPLENSVRSDSIAQRYARRTHCAKGHPFDEENTAWVKRPDTPRAFRQCKACRKQRQAGRLEGHRASPIRSRTPTRSGR